MTRTIGVVLAGGRSSRMGEDKARVTVGSATMIEHVVHALRRVSDAVVVSGRTEADAGAAPLPDREAPTADRWPGWPPPLDSTLGSVLVVVAVDQPWVRAETLAHLLAIDGPLPVVPVDQGIRQTTCAAYPSDALDDIDAELLGGGSIQSLLDRVAFRPVVHDEWSTWDEDGRSWFSADSVTDIEEGLRRFGSP
jgi:molybdenum cofactor guanylyltransferase